MGNMEDAAKIKLLAMDVDGVLTNGDIIYSETGDETKVFNIQDGMGIVVAGCAGLMTAIITGRISSSLQRRASELGINHISQGCRDKSLAIRRLVAELGLSREEIAFVGDDLNDIPAFREVGLKIAVSNAASDLKALADHITEHAGGSGAIREVIEMILHAQEKWEPAVQDYLKSLEQSECQI